MEIPEGWRDSEEEAENREGLKKAVNEEEFFGNCMFFDPARCYPCKKHDCEMIARKKAGNLEGLKEGGDLVEGRDEVASLRSS